MIIHILEK